MDIIDPELDNSALQIEPEFSDKSIFKLLDSTGRYTRTFILRFLEGLRLSLREDPDSQHNIYWHLFMASLAIYLNTTDDYDSNIRRALVFFNRNFKFIRYEFAGRTVNGVAFTQDQLVLFINTYGEHVCLIADKLQYFKPDHTKIASGIV